MKTSGYGSDATFTTRLVFRTAVLRYWHADRDGAVYRLFETFAEGRRRGATGSGQLCR